MNKFNKYAAYLLASASLFSNLATASHPYINSEDDNSSSHITAQQNLEFERSAITDKFKNLTKSSEYQNN